MVTVNDQCKRKFKEMTKQKLGPKPQCVDYLVLIKMNYQML